MHIPPLPEVPEFLRGRSIAVIDGAYAGGAEDGAAALAALRALGPEIDTWAMSAPDVLSRIHMDPEEPMPYASAGAMLGELDDAALDAIVANVAARGAADVRGAAPARRRAGARARGRRRGRLVRRRLRLLHRRPRA